MAISRKTFNTVKDILKELDERRTAARPEGSDDDAPRARAMPKRPEGARGDERHGEDDGPARGGVSDQLIG